MKLSSRITALAAMVAGLSMVSGGEVTGKITFKGTPPAPKMARSMGAGIMDPFCKAADAKTPIVTRDYLIGKDGGLENVVVYVKEGWQDKATPEPAKMKPLIDQVNCEYQPYVTVVRTNQAFLVRNSDPVMHNINVNPKSAGNPSSNKAQMAKAKDYEYSFEKPELFLNLACNVHGWMYARVAILESPFSAVTDKDGAFKIADLPPGEYTIEAAHHRAGKQTQKVKVDASGKQEINFTFEAPMPAATAAPATAK